MYGVIDKTIMMPKDGDDLSVIFIVLLLLWAAIYILQAFLAFGTAYRCTKNGNDNGVGLFIYLIGFSFAALIPGLGLHYYIKNLPPKQIIIQQNVQQPQPQIIRVVDPSQMNPMQQPDIQQAQYQYQTQQNPYQAQQNIQMHQQQVSKSPYDEASFTDNIDKKQ